MIALVRVLALALLLAGGYAGYLRVQSARAFLEHGRLLENADQLFLNGVFLTCAVALALMILASRGAPSSEGGKTRLRFGGLAKFFAAIALVAGARWIIGPSLNFHRIWTQDLLDELLASPEAPRVLGMEGLGLAVGLVSIVLALLVLFAPRRGG